MHAEGLLHVLNHMTRSSRGLPHQAADVLHLRPESGEHLQQPRGGLRDRQLPNRHRPLRTSKQWIYVVCMSAIRACDVCGGSLCACSRPSRASLQDGTCSVSHMRQCERASWPFAVCVASDFRSRSDDCCIAASIVLCAYLSIAGALQSCCEHLLLAARLQFSNRLPVFAQQTAQSGQATGRVSADGAACKTNSKTVAAEGDARTKRRQTVQTARTCQRPRQAFCRMCNCVQIAPQRRAASTKSARVLKLVT